MNKVYVRVQWMVLARHLFMPGGIHDYGTADIKGFFKKKHEAIKYAEQLFNETETGLIHPIIWVLKCEVTYQKGGVAISK